MLIALPTHVNHALATQKGEVALHTRLHGAM
jgi:hypothetical protein